MGNQYPPLLICARKDPGLKTCWSLQTLATASTAGLYTCSLGLIEAYTKPTSPEAKPKGRKPTSLMNYHSPKG